MAAMNKKDCLLSAADGSFHIAVDSLEVLEDAAGEGPRSRIIPGDEEHVPRWLNKPENILINRVQS